MLAVERQDRLPPLLVVGALLQLLDDPVDDVVFHRLVVRRDVVAVGAVEIGLADLERILAQRVGDVLDPALAPMMPCGPPKPRKAVLLTVLV